LKQTTTVKDQPARPNEWLLGLLLLAATLAAYQPVWHAGFVWDDDNYVTHNQTLHNLAGLRQIWLDPNATPQYYPLVFTTFWLEYHAWKLNPLGYHLVNVLLHALGSLLLWRALKRWRVPGAWLAAAIFALHPVNVESVAWITERKNVLSGLFFFAAAGAYSRFAGAAAGPYRRRSWLASLLLFVCALFSKTAACSLPVALLLALWWKEKQWRWRDTRPLIPFLIVGLWLALQTVWVEQHHVGAVGAEWSSTLAQRCLIAGRVVWFYLGKLLWPANLTFVYPRWQLDARVWWQSLLPAAALTGLAALWFGRMKFGRGPLATVLFFAATLFPVMGFLNVFYMRYSFVADHFQYLAEIGIIILAAGGLKRVVELWKTCPPLFPAVLCGSLLLTLGVLSREQCRLYADAETLWHATLARNPGCWLAHNNLGQLYLQTGRGESAIAEYRQALATAPDQAEARVNLGNALFRAGRLKEAIAQYLQAVQINPNDAEARNNLGNALRPDGDLPGAIAQYRKALEIDPEYADAHLNLGVALAQSGGLDEAVVHDRRAVQINPDSPEAHNNLGVALFSQTNLTDAITQYREALALDPGYANARRNLGKALLHAGDFAGAFACFQQPNTPDSDPLTRWNKLGRDLLQEQAWDEAIICLQQAAKIDPRAPDTFPFLGMAFFKKGQIREAIAAWQQALEIAPNQLYVLNNLAWLLATTPEATLRDGAKAVVLARQASQLSQDANPMVLHTLAAAYAEAGSYAMATATARHALELAVAQKNDALAATLQKEIKLYDANSPVRDTGR
jgi:tetratricopeptide (TPR) repeat protein